MFSIQKLFAKDDQFFKLLAASAQAGRESVQTLKDILQRPDGAGKLDELAAARRKDKEITGRITALLARTSVTSLDPEDIDAIATALNKIPKTVHKFAERYLIGAEHLRGIDFTAQIALAEQATETIMAMIRDLERSQLQLDGAVGSASILLSSSMAEHPAVNRRVVGSSPT